MQRRSGEVKALAVVIAVVLVAAQACSGGSSPAPAATETAETRAAQPDSLPQAEVERVLQELARRQGVEVAWQGGPYKYSYEWGGGTAADPTGDELARNAAPIARELLQYPDGFLRQAGLNGVVLVRDLFVSEDGGARGVAAYIFEDRLFLDVPSAERAVRAGTRVKFIHHIIWHRLDERAGTMWRDPEWVALNPPGFEYGVYSRGGVHETRSNSGKLTAEYPGFLNLYSTGNLPDDKAEVFSYLMVIHASMRERSRQDPYLARKIALIKQRFAAVAPTFDGDFWARIDADSDDPSRY